MEFNQQEIDGLKALVAGELSAFEEGGAKFIYIENLKLPDGCTPASAKALLCVSHRDGYPTRVFFSEQIASRQSLTWNAANVRIAGSNWWAYSWQVPQGLPLAATLSSHLKALQ